MLSRGGGAVAFQKVVSKVSDLPSPLDAEAGTRIIVRETEEVYGLNSTTRMWEPIGTLKKVGGKKPEELAAHLDAQGNPHGTALQDVLGAGASAKVDGEILITGKSQTLRLLSGSSALRVGPDAGKKTGLLWINAGTQGKAKTILRVLAGDGEDQVVLTGDGSLSSKGSASFEGGFKGAAHFDDEITASEGVFSADGYDLVLGGDKGVVLRVGDKDKAILSKDLLKLSASLELQDLRLHGQVGSDLIPSGDLQLGDPKARWAKAAVGDLDLAGQLTIQVPANSKAAPIKVSGAVPGDAAVLTAGGELGLGTDKPEARLDVRGPALIDGLKLDGGGIQSDAWTIGLGDHLVITRKGKAVLRGGDGGVTLVAGAKVEGDLHVSGKLAIAGIAGPAGHGITFGERTVYKAGSHLFEGALRVASTADRPLDVPGMCVENGNLIVGKELQAGSAALATSLKVGPLTLSGRTLSVPGEFELDAQALVAKNLRLLDRPKIEVMNELVLQGANGSAVFSMGGPACGVSFEGKSWELQGVTRMDVAQLGTDSLKVKGTASMCDGAAAFNKKGLELKGDLSVSGLTFRKVCEEVELNGTSALTKFELPAGVRVEAVVVKLLSDVTGARFLQVGDAADPDRFAGPSTDLRNGAVIRGLAHWERGRAVQKVKGPVTITADAAATGKLLVTVHFVDLAAL